MSPRIAPFFLVGLVAVVVGCGGNRSPSINGFGINDGEASPTNTGMPDDLMVSAVHVADSSDRAWICSGTVIGRHVVLTAAHCVVRGAQQGALVRVVWGPGKSRGFAGRVILHPDYLGGGRGSAGNVSRGVARDAFAGNSTFDLALIMIREQLPVRPVPLTNRPPRVGETLWVVGYGHDTLARCGPVDSASAGIPGGMPGDQLMYCGADSGIGRRRSGPETLIPPRQAQAIIEAEGGRFEHRSTHAYFTRTGPGQVEILFGDSGGTGLIAVDRGAFALAVVPSAFNGFRTPEYPAAVNVFDQGPRVDPQAFGPWIWMTARQEGTDVAILGHNSGPWTPGAEGTIF